MKELSLRSFSKYDTLIVGEAAGIDFERACEITKEGENLLDMLFHFEHVDMRPAFAHNKTYINIKKFKNILFKWQTLPETSQGALYYENHDQARSIPRFAPGGKFREAAAKSLAASLLFQKGTPFIYQGQELGMTNCLFKEADYRDIESVNKFKDIQSKIVKKFTLRYLQHYARDHARTPMQWTSDKNAGFTDGIPWMKINENYKDINVQAQLADKHSVLSFYKRVISVRKEYLAIVRDGTFEPIDEKNKHVFAFSRSLDGKRLAVICNLSPKSVTCKVPGILCQADKRLVLSNMKSGALLSEKMKLQPCECSVWELKE